jgi:diacylglycerol kinase (ATP)
MSSSETRGLRQIWRALEWSAQGLRSAWRQEASFRLEVGASAVLFPLGLVIGDGAVEKALLCGSLLLILSAELVNSSIEATVDRICPEIHEFAARVKDMSSAAVLLLMLNVVLCWGLVVWSRYAG